MFQLTMSIIAKYLNDILIVCFITDISSKWAEKSSTLGMCLEVLSILFQNSAVNSYALT